MPEANDIITNPGDQHNFDPSVPLSGMEHLPKPHLAAFFDVNKMLRHHQLWWERAGDKLFGMFRISGTDLSVTDSQVTIETGELLYGMHYIELTDPINLVRTTENYVYLKRTYVKKTFETHFDEISYKVGTQGGAPGQDVSLANKYEFEYEFILSTVTLTDVAGDDPLWPDEQYILFAELDDDDIFWRIPLLNETLNMSAYLTDRNIDEDIIDPPEVPLVVSLDTGMDGI